ncbi:MAG: radical SAM family heme chaperone HemW [Crocinitomicaceae bacterium]
MAGIYIHIPFCRKKCTYCDFHFSTTFENYRERMVDAIVKEAYSRAPELSDESVKTVYFGGGTPSVLNADELHRILKNVRENYAVDENVEITLEANPDDINIELLKIWKEEGVNRLSIGVQSFRSEDLEWMNRSHSAEQSVNAVKLAQREGFDNITIDLIYGLPNMSMTEWEAQLDQAIALNVPHISAYCLTVEPNTALAHLTKTGKIVTPGDQVQSEEFLMLRKKLLDARFIQYEVSNFGKEGFESQHNSAYWKNEKYLGIGPSAHSFDGVSRRWNVSNNQRYMSALETEDDYFEVETLSPTDKFNELLLTGLRTIYGVDKTLLFKEVSPTTSFETQIDEYKSKGWLVEEHDKYLLTPEGLLFADQIASELFLLED